MRCVASNLEATQVCGRDITGISFARFARYLKCPRMQALQLDASDRQYLLTPPPSQIQLLACCGVCPSVICYFFVIPPRSQLVFTVQGFPG